MIVWRWVAGSTAPIMSEHLLVEDADTPADEIVYSLVTSPTNGDVIIDGVGVTSFTQQLINDNRVLFAHRGAYVRFYFKHVFFQQSVDCFNSFINASARLLELGGIEYRGGTWQAQRAYFGGLGGLGSSGAEPL